MKTITEIAIKEIVAGNNDRTVFCQSDLQDLANSIKEHGLIQPITVREIEETGIYEIVAGERRYRACKLLGWDTIPVIIADMTNEEASAVMLAENIARQELDPIDEGLAYSKRMTAFGWSAEECATKAGVSTIRVQFRVKLLTLRGDIQQLIRTGNLSLGYAQIIASSGLDANFQTQAIRTLRDNPSATPGWFRRICSDLLTKQAQADMFSGVLFGDPDTFFVGSNPVREPPHPSTAKPPKVGKTAREVVENQIGFWKQAADLWQEAGKPFRRQECQAAAQALQLTLEML